MYFFLCPQKTPIFLFNNRVICHMHVGIFTQMGYAAGGAALGGVVAGPAGAMVGGIVGET